MTDDASGADRGSDEDAAASTPDGPRRDAGPTTDWHPDTQPITADRPDETDVERTGADNGAGESDRITLDLGDQESDDGPKPGADGQGPDDDPHAPEPSSTPIEAGDPNLEHVLFVVLGAIAMVLVLVQLITIPL